MEMASKRRGSQASNLVEVADTKMKVRTYSTLGLRPDADFMLWMISHSIEKMQILTSKVYSTIIGKYIEPSHVYLSCIRESVYSTNKIMPGFMTDEKLKSGRKFPQVRLNTSYSFGINDQDFMLAFETNDLIVFQDLIVQLRETRVSEYVTKDTPMIVCVYMNIEGIVRSIG